MTKPDLMAELAALLPADWEAQACGGHLLEITNFLRAHHAEIAAAVRDASVLRELVDNWRVLERVSGEKAARDVFKLCADQLLAAMRAGEKP
jgi:hypothetical protein